MPRSLFPLSYQARRILLAQAAPRYREASLAQKTLPFDVFMDLTEYACNYAIELLNQMPERKQFAPPV